MGTVATELETILDSDSDDDTVTISDTDDDSKPKTVIAGPQLVVPSRINYDRYRDFFLHVPTWKIQKTFENTTQFTSNVIAGKRYMQTHKSAFPALTIR